MRSERIAPWLGIAMLAVALLVGLTISAMGASARPLPATSSGAASASQSKQAPPADAEALSAANGDKRLDKGRVSPAAPLDTDTPTSTPTAYPTCGPGSDYVVSQLSGISIVPGVNDIGNHTDDGTTVISLPFAYNLYGVSFSSIIVGSNGTLGFSNNQNSFGNSCLPNSVFSNAILPHWDDLDTSTGSCPGCGIFTSISGSDPNLIFNIEWRTCLYSGGGCGGSVNFEVRLYQGQNRFDIIYGTVTNGGLDATVGVQRANGISWTEYECNTGGLTQGLELIFQPPQCGAATFTPTPTRQVTATPTPPTNCGLDSDYVITTGAATIIPGVNLVPGSQCDDCVVAVPLPFTYNLYTGSFSSVNASSNGNLQFSSSNSVFNNACLPTASMNNLISPHWDDIALDNFTFTGEGLYTTVIGVAPNRIFIIEWRGEYVSDSTWVNFEVLLYEGQSKFDFVYGVVGQGGSSATVGVQRGTGPQQTQYSCNTANSLTAGLRLTFTQPPCATSTPVPPTNTPTPTPGAGLLVGHVTWQNIPQNNPRSVLPITLTLKLGTSVEVNYPQQNTDATGFFTVNVGSLASGTYNWRVMAPDGVSGGNTGPGFLANCGTIVLAGAPQTNVEMGLMRGGDATNDNIVNTNDFNILRNDFGHGGVTRSDFDNSGVVNTSDFNIQKANFGQAGCLSILAPGSPTK